MENLRVLEGSEVFFRGLQHLYHQFESGCRLLRLRNSKLFLGSFFCIKEKCYELINNIQK